MTQDTPGEFNGDESGIRRYVPLVIWAIIILTILLIPLKIIGYGYLPPDDALRHSAKAICGKAWPDILVLGDFYKVDHNFGWHFLLRQIYLSTQCGTEGLVLFSVVFLFVVMGWSALPWLRRPESWLATLILGTVCFGMIGRVMLGRPFLLTFAVLLTILFAWQRNREREESPNWGTLLLMTSLIGVAILVHGVWYLWMLPVAAFFLARQFRWGLALAGSWLAGTILAALVTGDPVDYIVGAVQMATKAFGMHQTQRTLVSEFQSGGGDYAALEIFAGMLLLRMLGKIKGRPFLTNPAFWLALMAWILGFKAGRFWIDWGWPAMLVLVACDIQTLIAERIPAHSFSRLILTCGLAGTLYLATTADVQSRWTSNLTWAYLDPKEDPDVASWLPDKGGILYSADMSIFYQTFYKNPHGDWRYILGYESVLMPKEDFDVYHRILWNYWGYKPYKPWVDKMRPEDRLVIRGSDAARPNLSRLDWHYTVSGIWVGRLPLTNSVSATNAPPG